MVKKEIVETVQFTVQQASETLFMSQSSVYSWINRGRFRTKNTPSGKIILLSKKEADEIRKTNLESRRMKASKSNFDTSAKLQDFTENSEELQEITKDEIQPEKIEEKKPDPEVKINPNINITGSTLELVQFIAELSKRAGKAELLEDRQKQSENDAEYWRKQYFELQAEFKSVNAELAELKAKIAAQEQAAQKRGLFGLFK